MQHLLEIQSKSMCELNDSTKVDMLQFSFKLPSYAQRLMLFEKLNYLHYDINKEGMIGNVLDKRSQVRQELMNDVMKMYRDFQDEELNNFR